MAGYQNLSEFESGIVGAREMGHSISEVAMKFGFSRTRPFYECSLNIGNPVKHQIYDISVAGKKPMQERDQRRLTRIIKRDRRAILPQTAADFNAGPSISVTM
ncbi:HTH_Tnp_Tc3_2 domain-containing protein [Trichonephila clavipes]|nr:HTH_Tnp_Tc3_2 domain-containing protein [Trichonephila clavipes]